MRAQTGLECSRFKPGIPPHLRPDAVFALQKTRRRLIPAPVQLKPDCSGIRCHLDEAENPGCPLNLDGQYDHMLIVDKLLDQLDIIIIIRIQQQSRLLRVPLRRQRYFNLQSDGPRKALAAYENIARVIAVFPETSRKSGNMQRFSL